MAKPVTAGDLCSLELMRGAWILVQVIARDDFPEGAVVHFASFDLSAPERPTEESLAKVQHFALRVVHAAVDESAFLEARPVRLGARPVPPESMNRYTEWIQAHRAGSVSPSPGPILRLV